MKLSNNLLRPACLIALLAIASSALAAPHGYYRWKDDAGNEHFTQQPPAGRKSEFIAVSTGRSTAVEAGESMESTEAATNNAKASNAPKGPIQGIPDRDPEKCKQAHDTESVLNSHARIREKVGEEYRYLTPEEITEQKRLAQEATSIYCESAPAQ